jgi:transcriptional regulator with XRE-family HTH domain
MNRARHSGAKTRGAKRDKAPHGDFAARLAGLRSDARLTQSELAERLGASRRQIAYYESGRGRPPGALLGMLADLFHVSTDSLLGRENSRPTSRLGNAVLGKLRVIERMGGDAPRRLEATLDQFIIAEEWRRHPTRPRVIHPPLRARGGNGRRAARR